VEHGTLRQGRHARPVNIKQAVDPVARHAPVLQGQFKDCTTQCLADADEAKLAPARLKSSVMSMSAVSPNRSDTP
jgi:hypothetical protein